MIKPSLLGLVNSLEFLLTSCVLPDQEGKPNAFSSLFSRISPRLHRCPARRGTRGEDPRPGKATVVDGLGDAQHIAARVAAGGEAWKEHPNTIEQRPKTTRWTRRPFFLSVGVWWLGSLEDEIYEWRLENATEKM